LSHLKAMKILLTIHHSLDKNLGAPGATWNIGQAYQAQGHLVDYYSFDQLPKKLPEVIKGMIFPLYVCFYIMGHVYRKNLDVIVASSGDAWIWGKLIQRFFKSPPLLVIQSHGLS
jgi:hypothetical protein